MSGKFGLAARKCQGILFFPVSMNPALDERTYQIVSLIILKLAKIVV